MQCTTNKLFFISADTDANTDANTDIAIIIGSFFKNTITIQFCTPKSFREINFKAYTTEN